MIVSLFLVRNFPDASFHVFECVSVFFPATNCWHQRQREKWENCFWRKPADIINSQSVCVYFDWYQLKTAWSRDISGNKRTLNFKVNTVRLLQQCAHSAHLAGVRRVPQIHNKMHLHIVEVGIKMKWLRKSVDDYIIPFDTIKIHFMVKLIAHTVCT